MKEKGFTNRHRKRNQKKKENFICNEHDVKGQIIDFIKSFF